MNSSVTFYVTHVPNVPRGRRVDVTEEIQYHGHIAYCSVEEDGDYDLDLVEAIDLGVDYVVLISREGIRRGEIPYAPVKKNVDMGDWRSMDRDNLGYELDRLERKSFRSTHNS